MEIFTSGGSVRVTLSSGVGQGNSGTSLACRGCFVSCEVTNTEVVKMNIGIAASASLGVTLGRSFKDITATKAVMSSVNPLWVPIDDVSKLYFYSADDDAIIDITYLK